MHDDSGEPCAICWAVTPPTTMPFHLMWHDELELRELRLFRPGGLDAEVRELVSTVASIKGIPEPRADADFVSSLREQITAEAFNMALEKDAPQTRPMAEHLVSAGTTSPRPVGRRRLARAGAALAMMLLVATGTELVSHLRNAEEPSAGHRNTILPHPHPH